MFLITPNTHNPTNITTSIAKTKLDFSVSIFIFFANIFFY
jgi:hypothetical protein